MAQPAVGGRHLAALCAIDRRASRGEYAPDSFWSSRFMKSSNRGNQLVVRLGYIASSRPANWATDLMQHFTAERGWISVISAINGGQAFARRRGPRRVSSACWEPALKGLTARNPLSRPPACWSGTLVVHRASRDKVVDKIERTRAREGSRRQSHIWVTLRPSGFSPATRHVEAFSNPELLPAFGNSRCRAPVLPSNASLWSWPCSLQPVAAASNS
jgi:hypothetical protein